MGKKRIIKETKEELLKEAESGGRKGAGVAVQLKEKKGKIGRLRSARIYIQSTYNNTIITLTDPNGNIIAWSSAGAAGFKGPRKATPFAASRVIEILFEKVRGLDIREVAVFVRGVGSGRDAAVRALINHGLEISAIKDLTAMPHNGCRPRKPRRV